MTTQIIGNFSLNISTIIYMVFYIPQLFHNKNRKKLSNLSLHFHNCLLISYTTDLIYGFGLAMPWQYRLVSIVGTICLLIQHKQLWQIYHKNKYFIFSSCFLFLLLGLAVIAIFDHLPTTICLKMGYACQAASLIYTFPQIYKNFGTSTAALALNIGYLGLNMLCAVCDNISAWALHWPTPSKLGAIVAILACSTLVIQWLLAQTTTVLAHH